MHQNLPRRGLLFVLMALAFAVAGQAVLAHGPVTSSIPKDGETLKESPPKISIGFEDPLEPDSATMSVMNPYQQEYPVGEIEYSEDLTTVSTTVTEPLPDGAYYGTLIATSEIDGETFSASITFWVDSNKRSLPDFRIVGLLVVLVVAITGFGYLGFRREGDDLEVEPPEAS